MDSPLHPRPWSNPRSSCHTYFVYRESEARQHWVQFLPPQARPTNLSYRQVTLAQDLGKVCSTYFLLPGTTDGKVGPLEPVVEMMPVFGWAFDCVHV